MSFHIKKILGYFSYVLRRPHKNGHGVHPPFMYDLVTNVICSKKEGHKNKDIEQLRKELLEVNDYVLIEDYGAGSSKGLKKERKIADIALISSTSVKYGQLLHRMVKYYKPEIIIELGTCLGLGTAYMASGAPEARVYTIEGSKTLSAWAQENFFKLNLTNINVVQGNFDEVIPVILNKLGKVDFMFVDGNHKKEAMLRYYSESLPFVHDNSVMIFDDIRWSDEMLQGWLEICRHKNTRLSIDLFNWGIVFFNRKMIKQHFEIYY